MGECRVHIRSNSLFSMFFPMKSSAVAGSSNLRVCLPSKVMPLYLRENPNLLEGMELPLEIPHLLSFVITHLQMF